MIEIKNLTKKFHNDYDAICNLTCTFNNEPWAVVGSDMSGKTTLLNIIAGLDVDYDGEVLIGGVDRKVLKNNEIKISYITATPTLMENKSVYQNLMYVFKVYGDKDRNGAHAQNKVKEVCKQFNLFGILDKKIKKCNLFEKRLVCLARACLKNSEIILIDEPFFNLLNFEIASLWQTILAVKDKLSCMLIVAENMQNMGLFSGVNFLKLDFGVKID